LTVSADVIQIDICRFQLMRETFGDETASRFMNEYIERIRRILNEENYLAQIGKDEFLVVTKHHDPAYISSLAQKILCIGRTPIHCDGFDLLAPVNIGIAYYPDHGQNLTTLINATSAAVSSARTLGNNQFDIYQPEYSDSLKENMRLETLLRSAIGKNQLTLHYQPILNTQLQLEKVEALLRWTCAEKGPISPGIFIPIAEQSDLIYMIGHWVIKEACRQHALWRDSGLGNIKIAVNISSQQLKQQSLLTDIQEAIQTYNINARYIELEITETTLMEQLEHGRSLLRELKAMGLSLALDDFGTGYSSLAYLSEFPLDTLKVDRSFVKNIENEEHALILDTIIRLAKSLTLNIVAEGVETEFQHQHLLERHCDFYQGFLFARPMPAIDIESNIQNKQLLLSVPAEQA
ncbi:MAG: EAL domain-containing protein, partial [Oceanospirillaceae bacterium]|nr:EAL domain-containing protein [Oceanospirillaceae bacterium]